MVLSHLFNRFLEICLVRFFVEFYSEAADFITVVMKTIICVNGQLIGYNLNLSTLCMQGLYSVLIFPLKAFDHGLANLLTHCFDEFSGHTCV